MLEQSDPKLHWSLLLWMAMVRMPELTQRIHQLYQIKHGKLSKRGQLVFQL